MDAIGAEIQYRFYSLVSSSLENDQIGLIHFYSSRRQFLFLKKKIYRWDARFEMDPLHSFFEMQQDGSF